VGALTSWKPQGLSRLVMRLLYVESDINKASQAEQDIHIYAIGEEVY
jgi:hypothetical protein